MYYKATLARGTRWRVPRCIPSGVGASTRHSEDLIGRSDIASHILHQRPYRRSITRKGEFSLPLQSHRFFQKDQRERVAAPL